MVIYGNSSTTNTSTSTTPTLRKFSPRLSQQKRTILYNDDNDNDDDDEYNNFDSSYENHDPDYVPDGEQFDTSPSHNDDDLQTVSKERIDRIPRSLKNFENNCYLNSVVQSLFSFNLFMKALKKCCKSFKQHFSNRTQPVDLKEKLPIMTRLIELHHNYMNSSSPSVLEKYLREFKGNCGQIDKRFGTNFGKNQQQDAAEFFTVILDALSEEIDSNRIGPCKSVTNPVFQYFQYILDRDNVCPRCNQSSAGPSDDSNVIPLQLTSDRALQTAFLNIFCPEEGSACPHCLVNRSINKSFKKLPKLLVLQTGRTSASFEKDTKEIFASNSIYLPRKYVKTSILSSSAASPDKSCLKRSNEFVDSENNNHQSPSKKLKFGSENFFSENDPTTATVVSTQVIDSDSTEESTPEMYSDGSSSFVNNSGDSTDSVNFGQLTPPMDPSQCEKYQLVSVICHIGRSIGIGHYVSYVFSGKHSKWFLCNDRQIKEVPFDKLVEESSQTSLCYFYEHTKQ